jgi:UDP-N-acetylmuramyl pentapeptide phosphotransferase/UDP-N-acetylglucosamine-1-phosphate transferase
MGIVFFCVLFLVSFLSMEHSYKLILVWVFGFIITLVSFCDDMMNLSPKIRLLIQIIIGAVI